jgi:pimeloyl-ACP methyl ester carboxylesterase
MPKVQVNGVDLYYESHGEGPAIVWCPGADGNHLSWWQQVPHFMDRYRCIVFDMRGFGLTSVRSDQPGGAAFVDDVEALLDHLGIDDVRIVGQSMGGRPALGLALRSPERVKALVLADTTAGFTPVGMEDRLAELRKKMEETDDMYSMLVAHDYAEREPELYFLYRGIAGFNPARDADYMTRGNPAPPPSPDDLKALKMPVLLIGGDEDVTVPPDVLEGMHRTFRVAHEIHAHLCRRARRDPFRRCGGRAFGPQLCPTDAATQRGSAGPREAVRPHDHAGRLVRRLAPLAGAAVLLPVVW